MRGMHSSGWVDLALSWAAWKFMPQSLPKSSIFTPGRSDLPNPNILGICQKGRHRMLMHQKHFVLWKHEDQSKQGKTKC